MRMLLTGATGFIGAALVPALLKDGHELIVYTRKPDRQTLSSPALTFTDSFDSIPSATHFDAVINLAGQGIADRRWTEARKRELVESRTHVTQALGKLLARLETAPSVMISGSAVGWYGSRSPDIELSESASAVDEFTHRLCEQWEQAAQEAVPQSTRLCIVRLGVVLGKGGGMLQRLWLPFKLGLGGRIGDGQQMLSWIHRQDLVRGMKFLLQNDQSEGIYNLTSPLPIRNATFTKALARSMQRPAVFPLPAVAVKLAFGEMGERLLLSGQKVIPLALNRAGFIFDHETIDEALNDICGGG